MNWHSNRVVQLPDGSWFIDIFLFERCRLKEGSGSLLDLARKFDKQHGAMLIALRGDRILSENLVVAGLKHFLVNYYVRKKKLSRIAAIDALMYLFCTDQVSFIQKQVIPGNMDKAGSEHENLSLVLVSRRKIDDLQGLLLKLLDLPENEILDSNEPLIFKENLDFFTRHVIWGKRRKPVDQDRPIYDAEKKILATMAIFSMNVQRSTS